MSAGELREKITFAERALVSDSHGNNEGDFEDQFTVSARIRPRLGGEEVMAARLAGKTLATITVRYSTDTKRITSDWRATDARTGDVWNIRTPPINVDEKKKYLEMLCEKGVAP